MASLESRAHTLASYVRQCKGLSVSQRQTVGYQHMGATLADAILQAGLNYRTVVVPRVRRLQELWPEAATTRGVISAIDEFGANALLDWSHPEKPRRFTDIAVFLISREIDNETDLRNWMAVPQQRKELQRIRGIGPKTEDYLHILVGASTIAVDRHIRAFIQDAGLRDGRYDEARELVCAACELLEVQPAQLDHAIWSYMAANDQGRLESAVRS